MSKTRTGYKPEGKKRVGLAARVVAATLYQEIIFEGKQLQKCLEPDRAIFKTMVAKDHALVSHIVFTAIRRKGFIDKVLDRLMQKGMPKGFEEPLSSILGTALAQIFFMDVADHAAVFLAVEVAARDRKTGRFKKLINGVLREALRQKEDLLALSDNIELNYPRQIIERWRKVYDAEDLAHLLSFGLEPAYLDLQMREDIDFDRVLLQGDGLKALELPFSGVRLTGAKRINKLPGFDEGAWWVQDLASSIPARLLDLGPGKRVADLCAAPGGKTIQLCLTGADVTALDSSSERLKLLHENLQRLNLKADVIQSDVLAWKPEEPYDAILLDVPCSATGTFRKNPDVLWHRRQEDFVSIAQTQLKMLDHVAPFLKTGGELLYCVCSMEPEEGEEVIKAFLAKNSAFRRKSIGPAKMLGIQPMITPDGDMRLHGGSFIEDDKATSGMDGFFISLLTRV